MGGQGTDPAASGSTGVAAESGSSAMAGQLAVAALVRQAISPTFIGYFLVSVCALAVDMGTFLLLLKTSLPPGICAAIGYSAGIVVNWVLLTRSVFQGRTADRGHARTRQKLIFIVTTLGGLGATSAIVGLASFVGANLIFSKILSIFTSFFLNYFVRRNFVFAAARAS
jgi:putative flippase GtrA